MRVGCQWRMMWQGRTLTLTDADCLDSCEYFLTSAGLYLLSVDSPPPLSLQKYFLPHDLHVYCVISATSIVLVKNKSVTY